MVRTQLQFTEKQSRALRAMAGAQGVSVSELVRRLIDRGLREEKPDRETLFERAAELVGRFRDRTGADDVASDHDRYLDESYR